VAEYDPSGDFFEGWQGGGWHVFSPDGELLGRVAMPPGFKVHEIGGDYVLGEQQNELGVPFVRRFPLARSD
jgi:sugar lactone lactonase YvrE